MPAARSRQRLPGWAAPGALILALIAASLLSIAPLLLHRSLPRGDDVAQHAQFASAFAAGLAEGRWYPRWVAGANLGYGAPAFVFYPPAATGSVAVLQRAGLDLLTALRAGVLFWTLLAAAGAALLGRALAAPAGSGTGNGRAAALLTGALFVLLPYHALDVYTRFALAETATFGLLALLFLALERPPSRFPAPLAATFAALCFCHLPTAWLTALIAPIWVAARHGVRAVPRCLLGLLLGLAAASIYVLPAVIERPLVHADWLEENPIYRFDAHYLFGSGRVDVSDDPIHGARTATLELPTLAAVRVVALATAGLAGLAWFLGCWRRPAGGDPLHRWLVLVLVALLGMTRLADPLWRYLPGLAAVDFPWRLSIFVTLGAAVLSGRALAELARPPRRAGRLALLLVVALLVGPGLSARLADAVDWTVFTPEHAASTAVQNRVAGVFMPRSQPQMRGFAARFPPPPPVEVLTDGRRPEVRLLAHTPHHRSIEVSGPASRLVFAAFDYPGWRTSLDGAPVAHSAHPVSGAIVVAVPSGRHRVDLEFGGTTGRRLAAALSAVALAVLLVLTVRRGRP